ncbi:MAG: DUF3800 domain-containing protein [Lachnospiraceae bacterium]|nr:DUF3800 domain-containing protein [Lachnospiraceae bacterium]
MKELSIFIDESGDFGEFSNHSPYYIISMVFHDQKIDIQQTISRLDRELINIGLSDLCIHTGPIIRKEEIYTNMTISERRRIFNKMIAFIRQVDIHYHCFYVAKKSYENVVDIIGNLSKQISNFIISHYDLFLQYNDVKIYYDNGQVEVSKILSSIFNTLLPNPIFRKVMPIDYKLFQVADLICSMELIKLKLHYSSLSKSELNFFGNLRDLNKNYLKPLEKKEW